jgi:hypothetical protein
MEFEFIPMEDSRLYDLLVKFEKEKNNCSTNCAREIVSFYDIDDFKNDDYFIFAMDKKRILGYTQLRDVNIPNCEEFKQFVKKDLKKQIQTTNDNCENEFSNLFGDNTYISYIGATNPGNGVGTNLINLIEEESKKQKKDNVFLWSLSPKSDEFYEKRGYYNLNDIYLVLYDLERKIFFRNMK